MREPDLATTLNVHSPESSSPKMETLLYNRIKMRRRKRATPTGDPLRRWMVSGSPVENMAETKEPRSEERKWMARRRRMGRRKRPNGLISSENASVTWSPTRKGPTTTMATTNARSMPWGAPPC